MAVWLERVGRSKTRGHHIFGARGSIERNTFCIHSLASLTAEPRRLKIGLHWVGSSHVRSSKK